MRQGQRGPRQAVSGKQSALRWERDEAPCEGGKTPDRGFQGLGERDRCGHLQRHAIQCTSTGHSGSVKPLTGRLRCCEEFTVSARHLSPMSDITEHAPVSDYRADLETRMVNRLVGDLQAALGLAIHIARTGNAALRSNWSRARDAEIRPLPHSRNHLALQRGLRGYVLSRGAGVVGRGKRSRRLSPL
jgi:hypothetical protein